MQLSREPHGQHDRASQNAGRDVGGRPISLGLFLASMALARGLLRLLSRASPGKGALIARQLGCAICWLSWLGHSSKRIEFERKSRCAGWDRTLGYEPMRLDGPHEGLQLRGDSTHDIDPDVGARLGDEIDVDPGLRQMTGDGFAERG